MKTFTVTVDGVKVRFPESTTIVDEDSEINLQRYEVSIKKFMADIIHPAIKKMADSL